MPNVNFYEGTPGQPVKCLLESLELDDWDDSVELVETPPSSGRWKGVLPVGVYLVFEKAAQPTSYADKYLGRLTVTDVGSLDEVAESIEEVQSALDTVPKYGDHQRWTNPTEFLDVTVTKNP
jgi:hypothetical protein